MKIPADVEGRFHDNGFVICDDLFTAAEVAELDGVITAWEARWDELPDATGSEYAGRFDVRLKSLPITRTDAFRRLFELSAMAEATRRLIGADSSLLYGFAFATGNGGGQGWHKDSSDSTESMFTLNRLVYTRDYTPDQGMLYVLPGSHRYHAFPGDGPNHEDLPGQVAITPRAGMAVFVSSHCGHRVGVNRTDSIRTVLNSRVNPKGVPADLCDLPVFRSGRWRHSTQTFLGWNVA